jgi:hypothetical protein
MLKNSWSLPYGLGCEIYPNTAWKALPQRSFRFEPELHDMMHKSIEMGRALSLKNTNKKPMPLSFCGIIHTHCVFLTTNSWVV